MSTPGRLPSGAITFLSVARALVGVSFVMAPQLSCSNISLAVDPQASVVQRMFGIREIAVAALLWKAYTAHRSAVANRGAKDGTNAATVTATKSALRWMLWANTLVDLGDLSSCIVVFLTGSSEFKAAASLTPAASLAIVLGIVGLRGL